MKEKPKFIYSFYCTSLDRFNLDLNTTIKNKMMDYIFQKSKEKLIKEKNIDLKHADLSKIKRFDIPENYFNLIKTFITKILNNIKKEVGKDKIKIINIDVIKACFKRKGFDNWEIVIHLKGSYIDNR